MIEFLLMVILKDRSIVLFWSLQRNNAKENKYLQINKNNNNKKCKFHNINNRTWNEDAMSPAPAKWWSSSTQKKISSKTTYGAETFHLSQMKDYNMRMTTTTTPAEKAKKKNLKKFRRRSHGLFKILRSSLFCYFSYLS